MISRYIPGTTEKLPGIGLGASPTFIEIPEEGIQLPKTIIQAMLDNGGSVLDVPSFFRPNVSDLGKIFDAMPGVKEKLFKIGKITVRGKQEGIDHLEKLVAGIDVDTMDLLMVHNMRELELHWPTLKDWKEQGRTRYIGVSLTRTTDYSQLEKFMQDESPDIVMTGYSITQQGPAERVLPMASDLGIAVIVAEPFKAINDGAYFDVVAGKTLPEWAADYSINSWAQFTLKWILSDPAITSIVTETSKVKHAIDNMGGGYGLLPDQTVRKKMSDLLLSFA